jgi:hypothetical protein
MELRLPRRTSTLRLPSEIRLRGESLIKVIARLLELVAIIIVAADALASLLGSSHRSAESRALLGSRHTASAAFDKIVFDEARRGRGEGREVGGLFAAAGGGVFGGGAVAVEAGGGRGARVGGCCGGQDGVFVGLVGLAAAEGAWLALRRFGGCAVAELGEEAADALGFLCLLLLDVWVGGGGALAGCGDGVVGGALAWLICGNYGGASTGAATARSAMISASSVKGRSLVVAVAPSMSIDFVALVEAFSAG